MAFKYPVDTVDTDSRDALTTGETVIPRRNVNTSSALSAGVMLLSYFTARKTESINSVRSATGSTAAVGATLARIGIYSVASNGDITLVASCANDTGLWIATSTVYTKTLSAAFSKVRGSRYAVGFLIVGSSTQPTLNSTVGLNSVELGLAPRICGFVSGQTDLPSSVSAGSVGNTSVQLYAALAP